MNKPKPAIARQTLYTFNYDDAVRIDEMIELIRDTLWQLLECRKVVIPHLCESDTDSQMDLSEIWDRKNEVNYQEF